MSAAARAATPRGANLTAAALTTAARSSASSNTVTVHREFVVEAPARLLKRNEHLSKNARRLYLTMKALADATTGELKIEGRWLRAEAIDKAAEMCREVRMKAMKELIGLGLTSLTFGRVRRKISGRWREVRGRSQYVIHPERERILLKSISSTVEKIDSQVFSKPPIVEKAEKAFSHLPCSGKVENSPAPTKPKGSVTALPRKPTDVFQQKANATLVREGLNPDLVTIAIARIADWTRVKNIGVESAAYFEKGARNSLLNDSEEFAECQRIVAARIYVGETMRLPLRADERRESTNLELAADLVRQIRLRFPTLDRASQKFDLKILMAQQDIPDAPSFADRALDLADAEPDGTLTKSVAGGRR